MFEIEFYELPNGKKPVKTFLDSLEPNMRAKAVDNIAILAEFGNMLREPYVKNIGNGLFELRIRFAGDITRIFYFFAKGKLIILTNGFVKKTQKTPDREKQMAIKYKAEYERRLIKYG